MPDPVPSPLPVPSPRIVRDWRAVPPGARGAAVALGNFDGVHLGHRAVLAAAHAARPDTPLAVLSFEPHPRQLFRPEDPPFRLMTAGERAAALAACGVSVLFEMEFDQEFSWLEAEAFVADVLCEGIGAAHLACGPDFAFGHRRGGDTALLARRAEAAGVGLTLVPPLTDAAGPISSTRIRRDLQDGYPARAAAGLGRPWEIGGVVEHGDARGRTIGFPTANIALGEHIEPARGVYAVTARLPDGRAVPGVANIGRRPTVASGTQSRVETHLFDFAEDLYGQFVSVALHAFLRDERRFDGLDALKAQIAVDAAQARDVLGREVSKQG
jgi:riboflavin kinase/FMN adenylyltransferase